ncbi:Sodium-coupled neutral amino acid transporter 2 [Wickerhamomyces ciferrii]|uniref:Sodium-coupled neutral amino acid transporter 2 n=1 Tax=Wickerhamomyces ciferrii (strain ATCC 14091 / BCRC 22168 / CBS 111 / JCM 3599 / NBRC 0793 / NRRL Y-1031 F-60-10) TaxID=1206466 RepID=K0KAM0_WICCF|nr:Sodium-coupled neutral amino acid transporter 2 [Wickerhamomyces ciferrii]CCH42030.1 Sodium-coupled neutral amino acid transporter 2 [Wickerhamomyces ciferrii]
MASVQSSVINLTKTIIGAGLLAIPFAFKADGLILGTILILIAGIASSYGLYIVSQVSKKLPGDTSYFALCGITYPKLTLIFDFSIAIQCFGVALSYLVLIGDLVPSLINEVLSRNQVILLSLIIIIPLISFRKLDSLKIGSLIGLLAIGYLTILVISHSIWDDWSKSQGHVKILEIGSISQILSTFSIVVFAFTAAQNICSIINEINDQSQVPKVITLANLIASLLFLSVGFAGYLQFGDNVHGNVILEYKSKLLSSKIGKFALVLMVTLSYPLMFHPCRLSTNNMIHWIQQEISKNKTTSTVVNERTGLINDEESGINESNDEVPFSTNRFVLVTTLLTLGTYGLALSIKSFELVLSLVGATGSTLICFILPGLFGFKLFPDNDINKSLSLSLTIFGFIVMIASVFATLYY